MRLVVRVENLPSPEHVLWLITNYKTDHNHYIQLDLIAIENQISRYLSEKLSLKIQAQVYHNASLREGVTVIVAGGRKIMFYSYESLFQKDVFMLRVFKDFILT
jgi:hypothetical protein